MRNPESFNSRLSFLEPQSGYCSSPKFNLLKMKMLYILPTHKTRSCFARFGTPHGTRVGAATEAFTRSKSIGNVAVNGRCNSMNYIWKYIPNGQRALAGSPIPTEDITKIKEFSKTFERILYPEVERIGKPNQIKTSTKADVL